MIISQPAREGKKKEGNAGAEREIKITSKTKSLTERV